jgi:DNA-binding XRE family transcriptional regulator
MSPLSFGERVHLLRRRMTQAALAQAIGVSKATIFRIEKGDFDDVKGKTVVPLTITLCIWTDYLHGLTEDDHPWNFEKDAPLISEAEAEPADRKAVRRVSRHD